MGAVENCKKNDSALHFVGLVSNGGVHSHIEHLFGLIDLAHKNGLKKVYVHCITDGRDVSPTSGVEFIEELQNKLDKAKTGKIATIMGRYYAMDRDTNWDRVVKAYNAMVKSEGQLVDDPIAAMKKSYETKDENGSLLTDEFIRPMVVCENGKPVAKDAWTVVYVNTEQADEGPAEYLFDESARSYWHSQWKKEPTTAFPHRIIIDLGEIQTITGIEIQQRNPNMPGCVKDFSVYGRPQFFLFNNAK